MATDVTKLVLAVDSTQVKKSTAEAHKLEKAGEGVEKNFQRAGSAMKLMAGILTGAAVAKTFSSVLAATITQEKAVTQLNSALRSTGRYTPELSKNLQSYAASLQGVTNFGDEATIASQALLLTFTRIGGTEFPRAQKAILDVATAMGTDLKSATIQVGKALNDPVEGMTALSRSGITFSQSQKDLVKELVKTGRAAEAQRVILDELETQFGGSAEAARKTLGGALTSLKNAFGDLLEGDSGGGGVRGAASAIEELTKLMSDPQTVKNAQILVNGLIAGFGTLTKAISQTVEFTSWLGEELAARAFGIAADDVARLEIKLERLQKRQKNAPRGLRIVEAGQIEEIKKQLAMARETQDAIRTKPPTPSAVDVPVLVSGFDVVADDAAAATAKIQKLRESWEAVALKLQQAEELRGLSGLGKDFAEITHQAEALRAQFGPEYSAQIDEWAAAMLGMAQAEHDAAAATERRAQAQATATAIADNNAAAADRVASAMEELTLATMTGEEREIAMITRQYERLQGMARELAMLGEISEVAADQMQQALGVQMAEALDDLKEKGADTGKSLTDSFAGWANSHVKTLNDMLWSSETTFEGIVESFAKMVTEMLIQSAMLDLVGNGKGGSGGTSGIVGSIVNGIDWGSLLSFDGGGDTPAGGRAGGVDGKGGFPAILHPNETVIDNTKNNQPAPQVNTKIVNVMDPSIVGDYLATSDGEQIIMNVVQKNGG